MVFLSTHTKKEDHTPTPTPENQLSITSQFEYTNAVSVYGSHWASEEIPKYELPVLEMPPPVAKQLIHDELALDGNPSLNLGSFVTTWIDEEAKELIKETAAVNIIDLEMYPRSAEIASRCVNMLAHLYNAPKAEGDAIGCSTLGSSEGVMLSVLAMKKRWQERQRARGRPTDKPNLVMGAEVQVCWHKATRYLEIEGREVPIDDKTYIMDPALAMEQVDENTIGIVAILGTTYTGHYEDIKAMNDLLDKKCKETGDDIYIHVDAASGGFVAPFVNPDLEWDFRLSRVCSINVSGHKYGLVYPGIGWCIWRNQEALPKELIFYVNYLGSDQASFTLNFSKSASHVIAQYYNFIRHGIAGYTRIMENLTHTSDYLAKKIENTGRFKIISATGGRGLPLVAFRLKNKELYDEFDIAAKIRERQWIVPAYTMCKNLEEMKVLRIVVREDMSRSKASILVDDIIATVDFLDQFNEKTLETIRKQKEKHSHRAMARRNSIVTPDQVNQDINDPSVKRTHVC
ncbi:glutamate decarboxylase [Cunninghamella echinulata]|nr:glutamate decarboxylase [Cunninghamella echinulata]